MSCIRAAASGALVVAIGAAESAAGPTVAARHLESRGATTILELDRDALAGAGGEIVIGDVAIAPDVAVDLVVERFRVTGPHTRFVNGATGADIDFDPEEIVLLRGHVAGAPDSHVFLAVSEHGSAGRIELGPAGPSYRITDQSGGGITLGPGQFAVWQPRPGIGPLLGVPSCGLEDEGPSAPPSVAGTGPSPATRQIELAIDTDYEFFTLFGDEAAASAYVVQLYAAVSDIYLRDVNTYVELTFVRIWDTEADLFNADDPLEEFVTHWNDTMGGVDRDVAQFLTGRRNLPYGGVAYLSVLCSEFAYSVAGYALGSIANLESPDFGNWDVIVSAHELGHNAGTLHTHNEGIDNCAGGDLQRGTIMSYCHTTPGGNANIDLRFHADIQPFIEGHVTSSSCIIIDCNGNGTEDASDIGLGDSDDVNGNGVPDECEDCNDNSVLDPTDILLGTSDDDNGNGIPDECEPDCNVNGVPDDLDIALGDSDDLYGDGIPDECAADCNTNGTSDYNEIQADMSLDLDRNAILDACQDCDDDLVTDFEVLAGANNLWVAGQIDDVLAQIHGGTGVLVTTGAAGQLANPSDLVVRGDGHVLVSSFSDDRVVEFDAGGAVVGDLVPAGFGGLSSPRAMVLSPGGTLLVASNGTDNVLEYDAFSGAALGEFVAAGSGGLSGPYGLAWGPNGNLFVTTSNDEVLEYDGGTGASVGTFVSGGSGGLTGARGLVFKPDGNLVVASFFTDELLEFDGATGAALGQWDFGGNDTGFWALIGPWELELGPDANVYVTSTSGNAAVHMYESTTGSFMRSYYVLAAAGPIGTPTALGFIPGDAVDCNLNFVPDSCDITSGSSNDANSNGIPDECEQVPGDADGDGIVGINDFLIVLGSWGPCPGPCPPSCAADFDGDCVVGINDFLIVLGNWSI